MEVQLAVVGVAAQLIESDEQHAGAAESLLLACGEETVDRFDARLLLDPAELQGAGGGGSSSRHAAGSSCNADEALEAALDEERYADLDPESEHLLQQPWHGAWRRAAAASAAAAACCCCAAVRAAFAAVSHTTECAMQPQKQVTQATLASGSCWRARRRAPRARPLRGCNRGP